MEAVGVALGVIFVLTILAIPVLVLWNVSFAVFRRGVKTVSEARSELRASTHCVVCGSKGTIDVHLTEGQAYVLCDNPECARSPRLAPLRGREVKWVDKMTGQPRSRMLDLPSPQSSAPASTGEHQTPDSAERFAPTTVAEARRSHDRDPQDPHATAELARALARAGEAYEAERLWGLLQERGHHFLANGQWREAAQNLELAAEAGYPEAMLGVGQVLRHWGRLAEAHAWFARAVKAGSLEAADALAEVIERQRRGKAPSAPNTRSSDPRRDGSPTPSGVAQGGHHEPPQTRSVASGLASTSTPTTGFCGECRQRVSDGAKFCGSCGAPVVTAREDRA